MIGLDGTASLASAVRLVNYKEYSGYGPRKIPMQKIGIPVKVYIEEKSMANEC